MQLFSNGLFLFKDLNFTKLLSHVQWVCESASPEIQSAYFKAWTQSAKNTESLTRIIVFIFAEFDTLR